MRKYMTAAALEPTDTGSLQVNVVSAENNFPIRDAEVSIAYKGDPESTVESTNTNSSGQTGEIRLAAPPLEYSLSPGLIQPYSEYTITIRARGFAEVAISGTEILPDALAIQPVRMTPLADEVSPDTPIVIPDHTLYGYYPPKIAEAEVKPVAETGEIVLSRVVVPQTVVVHDGVPTDSTAPNYYVPYRDYIKNVASSEIYATWPRSSITANVLAIMSFTLNRVYTEWYRNQGYDFTITSSTAFDHKWIYGRNIFQSISEVVGLYMGKVITFIMRVFSVVLLVMVGVNFSVGPAGLLAKLTPDMLGTMFWLVVIMVYYLIATFLPIDKIIGKLYPVFGICLIIMALGIGGAIVLTRGSDMPELTAAAFTVVHPDSLPKWSMMFVTVACGAISGFHATQSPMMARCITSEKQGRTIFYGAMVAEGVIALIWAAAGVTFYTNHGSLLDGMTGLTNAIAAGGAGDVVYQISTTLLGPVGGVLAMIGVIACPITSGDTAYRSARLTIADWFHIDQAKVGPRAALSVPLLAVGAVIALALPWDVLWRYFSWANQTLAMIVLWTGAVFLHKFGYPPKACFIAALPATFMSAVSVTYFFQAPECLGLSTAIAYPVGIVAAALFLGIFIWRTLIVGKDDVAPLHAAKN